MDKFYNITEASEILNVSVAALRKWVLERRIGFHKIGNLVRFSNENLIEFANREAHNGSKQQN